MIYDDEQSILLPNSNHLSKAPTNNNYITKDQIFFSPIVSMTNYEVTELTWENGQLAMHEMGGVFSHINPAFSFPEKSTWGGGSGGRAGDTLESIVDQATYYSKQTQTSTPLVAQQLTSPNMDSVVASTPTGPILRSSGFAKKRTREINNDYESACASKNTEENNDTTMMTLASCDSPRSGTRTKTTTDDDSAYNCGSENQEEVKSETGRSYTTRKGRAAVVHNQSERRRRDRINQKMKALQKLVPNARKTDKASMLDEVIEYLKQLQAQVQMMSNARFMPQIMMQQQIQMSLMARMGMGMGIGMFDTTAMAHGPTSPQIIHPTQVGSSFMPSTAFVVPQVIPEQGAATSGSNLQDPYSTLLAQSMNIDMYNRMAALQRQQQQQQISAQPASTQMQLS